MQITLLHLHTVRKLLSDPIVQHAVDVVEVRIRSLYDQLPLGQWRLLRQTLCRFFQNRRIKVLRFCQRILTANGMLHALTCSRFHLVNTASGMIAVWLPCAQ